MRRVCVATAAATRPNIATRHTQRPGRTGVSHPGQCRDLNLCLLSYAALLFTPEVRGEGCIDTDS